ncbi:hypothetical protein TNCV_4863701 [Trichonephila clavipes]|nr:hypothetical protein TNCV_4863701 [Trichonephila clavipes]
MEGENISAPSAYGEDGCGQLSVARTVNGQTSYEGLITYRWKRILLVAIAFGSCTCKILHERFSKITSFENTSLVEPPSPNRSSTVVGNVCLDWGEQGFVVVSAVTGPTDIANVEISLLSSNRNTYKSILKGGGISKTEP